MARCLTRSSKGKDTSDNELLEDSTELKNQEKVKSETKDNQAAIRSGKRKKSPSPDTSQKAARVPKHVTKMHDQTPTRSDASSDQVLRFLLSKVAVDMCRPEDEVEDLSKRGRDIKTYAQLLSPFEELVCAVVLSRPISHRLGLRTIRTIMNPPYEFKDADTIKAAGADKIHQALDDARTQHRGKTSEEIELIAKAVKDNDWHNDLEKLRKEAKNEVKEEREVLRSNIKGLGKTGLDIFYRRIQWLWDEAYPFVDSRTRDSFEKLGLPTQPGIVVEMISKNWKGLDFDDSGDFNEEERKRRAFVLLLERCVGADLENKIEDILAAAVVS